MKKYIGLIPATSTRAVKDMVGGVNNATFLEYPAGSVRFSKIHRMVRLPGSDECEMEFELEEVPAADARMDASATKGFVDFSILRKSHEVKEEKIGEEDQTAKLAKPEEAEKPEKPHKPEAAPAKKTPHRKRPHK